MTDESWELLDLRQLRHLVAVASVGSFTAAADELGLSQPGLSSSIRRLEAGVGVPLLERTTRRVTPTPAGAELVRAARPLLAGAADARSRVHAVAGLTGGELAMGAVQTFTSVDLAALLADFHTEHPGVQISLQEDTTTALLDALTAGELDLAFVALGHEGPPPGIRIAHSYDEELVLITGPGTALAEHRQTSLTELGREAFVEFEAGVGLQTVVEQICADAGLRRRIAFTASEMPMVLSLVRHCLGVAIVPRPVAASSGLPVLNLGGATRRLALVLRTGEPGNPAVRALLDLLDLSLDPQPGPP